MKTNVIVTRFRKISVDIKGGWASLGAPCLPVASALFGAVTVEG
jgi:hypothetical protein